MVGSECMGCTRVVGLDWNLKMRCKMGVGGGGLR